ncbi:MAG TPA: AAA family ATPase [Candidatus Saccharimonadales bacterium]|nr:AAA family ATPase [Candidatus Saccharimonadales bacterium]
MSLFFITGIAGTGKTTVWQELKSRGYEAYDVDESGLAKWQNKETGYVHPKSSVKKEQRTREFLESHSWNVSRQEVEELAVRAKDKDIFLCGAVTNEIEIRDLFKLVFALMVDNKTLKHRLLTRVGNAWGKQPHELEQTLVWQHDANEAYKKFGDFIIDSSRPINDVVNDILKVVNDEHLLSSTTLSAQT